MSISKNVHSSISTTLGGQFSFRHRNRWFYRDGRRELVMLGLVATLTLAIVLPATDVVAKVLPIDRVIAVVNNEVITDSELKNRIQVAVTRLEARRERTPDTETMRRTVLEQIIIERAESQHADQIGIKVDREQIDRAVETIAKDNKLTVSELGDRLKKEGVSLDSFRKDVRNQIVRARIRETQIQSGVVVSDADIDAYLLNKKGGGKPAEYKVTQVFIKLSESADDATLKKKKAEADAMIERLKAGEDFDQIAAAMPEARSGGQLGWRALKNLPDLFSREVRNMKKGDISGVLRSAAGLHILRLVDTRHGGADSNATPVVQSKVRHILIRPEDGVGEDEIVRRLAEIKDRVLAGSAQFEAMARQYSVDGSAGRGGDIGWVYPGDTVPAFERAVNSLQPGKISDPIRTQFGFHLIQLLERREDQASEERQRLTARQEITRQRTDEAYREWRAELRDRTYVELRLE